MAKHIDPIQQALDQQFAHVIAERNKETLAKLGGVLDAARTAELKYQNADKAATASGKNRTDVKGGLWHAYDSIRLEAIKQGVSPADTVAVLGTALLPMTDETDSKQTLKQYRSTLARSILLTGAERDAGMREADVKESEDGVLGFTATKSLLAIVAASEDDKEIDLLWDAIDDALTLARKGRKASKDKGTDAVKPLEPKAMIRLLNAVYQAVAEAYADETAKGSAADQAADAAADSDDDGVQVAQAA
jgi:hypothetical protein